MLKSLRPLVAVVIFALVAVVLVTMPRAAEIAPAHAANAADFDAGYIISDANFYNGRAMTSANEVQAFLQSKNSGCSSGATCILNYKENTPTMAASAYCDRIEGRSGESAASVIYRVGQACNISQMALIVLLEKEQSLITMAAPSATRFERATGYACPDTAPCNAGFGGFFTQVYYGARAYQYYKEHPAQYRHQANAWNAVLYNPNSSCGSSQVFIRNAATAGLYNYTPYQPNRAALNNLYGVGDTCSAYGNRNFWRLFTDWFGNPTGNLSSVTRSTLVSAQGSSQVWLVDNGHRYPINTKFVSQYTRVLGNPATVTTKELASLTVGAQLDLTLRSGHRIWNIYGGERHEFLSCSHAAEWGFSCDAVPSITNTIIHQFKNQGVIRNIVSWSGGGWWYIKDGVRHQVPEHSDLARLGVTGPHSWMAGNGLQTVDVAAPMVPVGDVIHDRTAGTRYMSTRGGFIEFNAAQAKLSILKNSKWVWAGSADKINGQRLWDRMNYHGSPLVLTDKGLVYTSARQWGDTSLQTTLKAPILWGVPIDSTRVDRGGFLVQQIGSSTVWLIRDGYREQVPSSRLAQMRSQYGEVLRTASDTAIGVRQRPIQRMAMAAPMTVQPVETLVAGDVVRVDEIQQTFVYSDEEGLIEIESSEVLDALGIGEEPRTLTELEALEYERSPQIFSGWLFSCGEETYLASAGLLHAFEPFVATLHFGGDAIPLPSDLCAIVEISENRVSQVLQDDEGELWFIQHGERSAVTDEWLEENGIVAADIIEVPLSLVETFPEV